MARPLPKIGPPSRGQSSGTLKSKSKNNMKLPVLDTQPLSPVSTMTSFSPSNTSSPSNHPFSPYATSPFGPSSPVRNTLGLPNNFMNLDYVEKLSYCKAYSPYHVTTLAPLPRNPQSSFCVTKVDMQSLNTHNIKLINEKSVAHGHESYKDMEPDISHVAAYKAGVNVNCLPMRISTHCLRGIKTSKQAAGNADKNTCRPHGGGFYATA